MDRHEYFMKRCIQLALNGLGTTYPNPLVGAVIVYKDKIIGEGWHKMAGEPHAEVHAINAVKDGQLLREATLYVNLEPCSHHGKTPPCADLIIKKGIKKVVIGSKDYHSKVNGQGIQHLLDAGCEVITGILEEECLNLNRRFFTFHIKKRPYIILKWAQTANGFISPATSDREQGISPEDKRPYWISNDHSLQFVHQLRTREQSILVGTNTAETDNPSLNARMYFGKNPLRLVIDKDLKLNQKSKLFDGQSGTVVFYDRKLKVGEEEKNVVYRGLDFDKDITGQICLFLYNENFQSLIVEGGTYTLQKFIDKNLWDEAIIIAGKESFRGGTKAPSAGGKLRAHFTLGDNCLTVLENENALSQVK